MLEVSTPAWHQVDKLVLLTLWPGGHCVKEIIIHIVSTPCCSTALQSIVMTLQPRYDHYRSNICVQVKHQILRYD